MANADAPELGASERSSTISVHPYYLTPKSKEDAPKSLDEVIRTSRTYESSAPGRADDVGGGRCGCVSIASVVTTFKDKLAEAGHLLLNFEALKEYLSWCEPGSAVRDNYRALIARSARLGRLYPKGVRCPWSCHLLPHQCGEHRQFERTHRC